MLLRILLGIAAVVVAFWIIGVILNLLWVAVVIGVVGLAIVGLVSLLKGTKPDKRPY